MLTPDNNRNRSRLLQGLCLLMLSIAVVAGLGWAAGRQQLPGVSDSVGNVSGASGALPPTKDEGDDASAVVAALGLGASATSLGGVSATAPKLGGVPASAPKLAGGYPPPVSPSPTPEPDEGGLFPPPSVEHEIVTRDGSPFGDLIVAVERGLALSDGSALRPWVDQLGSGLSLDNPGATEGIGTRLSPDQAADVVDQLFATGAEPVVQGYFEEAGCDRTLPEFPPCAAVLVVTGLGGPVPMPTKHPSETLGPPAPNEIPLEAAAWSIYPDSSGPYWTDWWMGNGYYELVDTLVQEGHGTYFVLR